MDPQQLVENMSKSLLNSSFIYEVIHIHFFYFF